MNEPDPFARERMELFDSMPASVRAILREAPLTTDIRWLNFTPTELAQIIANFRRKRHMQLYPGIYDTATTEK